MIHGINLLLLLVPALLFYLAYKIPKARKVLIVCGFVSLVAMPFKMTNKPDVVRATQDAVTYDRYNELPEKVKVEKEPYEERMEKKHEDIEKHSTEKLERILE